MLFYLVLQIAQKKYIFNPKYFDLMLSVLSIMQYSNSKVYFHTGICVYTCITISVLLLVGNYCRWRNEVILCCAISHKITIFLNFLNLYLFSYSLMVWNYCCSANFSRWNSDIVILIKAIKKEVKMSLLKFQVQVFHRFDTLINRTTEHFWDVLQVFLRCRQCKFFL